MQQEKKMLHRLLVSKSTVMDLPKATGILECYTSILNIFSRIAHFQQNSSLYKLLPSLGYSHACCLAPSIVVADMLIFQTVIKYNIPQ